MTCIVEGFKTKKALKEQITRQLETDSDFFIEDPSIFKPRRGFWASEMVEGQSEVVTNHPKRSWFAKIERKNGRLVVT